MILSRATLSTIIKSAQTVEVSSGEGCQGTVEGYPGRRSIASLVAYLRAEEDGGDRWAYAYIDGVKYEVSGDTLRCLG